MAVYDREQQRIVLRIVYDGPARAGKTTNVKQLSAFFTHRRRSDVIVPEEVEGRTMFFDWMQLDGGLVAGETLRCQFVTVPGQRRLAMRRKSILESADVVVFVCSSSERSLPAARGMFDTLKWALRGAGRSDVPIVVQANKQDLKSAVSLAAVREAMGLPDTIQVVGASANTGAGVRETAVLAIRAAANTAETFLFEHGLDALLGRAETAEDLLARICARAPDPPAAADLMRELREPPDDEDETDGDIRPPIALVFDAPTVPPARALPEPPLPREDVPSGCVWPSFAGRQVLRTLMNEAWRLRDDLAGQPGTSDGSGATDVQIYQAGDWCAKTSLRRRFGGSDEGRTELLTLARRKILLGELLVPSTVLVLQQAASGEAWLWTLTPWVTTLRAQMAKADAEDDEDALAQALCRFGDAAIAALQLAVRREVVLDVHPSNFGAIERTLFYIDDDIATGSSLPAIGHVLLQRIEEYAERPVAVARYLAHLLDQLASRIAPVEARALSLSEHLEGSIARHARAVAAKEDLLEVVRSLERRRDP